MCAAVRTDAPVPCRRRCEERQYGGAIGNIVKDESAIRYTGKAVIANGTPQTLTAVLTDPDGGAPLTNGAVTFTIGPLVASAVTDANGVASTSLTVPPSLGTGPIRLDIAFAGDATNVPAFTSVPVILYQPQSFVVWGGNSVPPRVGDHVNFWGSQWPKQVSAGDYDGKSDFKGWAVPAGSPLVSCEAGQHADGKCWSSKPGQSFPPATIERYVRVIVSTSIAQAKERSSATLRRRWSCASIRFRRTATTPVSRDSVRSWR